MTSRSPLLIVPAIIIGIGVILVSGSLHKSYSVNLTSVTDTLSTSRLSWVGREAAGNIVGSAIVNIDTTANTYESTSSANLFVNDTIRLGNGAAMGSYTVKGILSTSQIQVTPVLASGQATAGQFMIASRSATHTLAFTSGSAIPNGAIRVLIPAVTNTTNAADGIPDRGGFDYTPTAPSVTCPSDVSTTYDFVTGTATASAVTINSVNYHAFECRYSGTGVIGQAFTGFIIGTSNPLINPAANASHVAGTADTYRFIIQNLDSTNTAVDSTAGQVAVVESVRVTATVDPQITFRIGGVSSGTSACGLTTSVTTTSAIVPLGSLSISAFTSAAQSLSVSTNAAGGYVVTTIQSDQMGKDGNTCTGAGPTFSNPCIPDSAGDTSTMSVTTTDAWTSTSVKGFAYTLADPNSTTTEAFNNSTGYRKFDDTENSGTPRTIFSDTTVADNANVYVCYKAVISTTQQAGDYTNNITYRATATF